ncbi:P-loop ATPase, Sll1717 family [Vibrio coralliilyticus]|uniref:P-loop ATPase, Sll1717 family n=1 Tax=Vibrio coralliilyticus TaxID=190893 RepID=UPI000BAACF0A|nr:funZ protein [Vibrio coralliilyticus]NOI60413.1 funZ protein [Vibrio coralliilyticus]PAT65816.1 funZ protein [Vibrio coralliilyticus]
MKKVVDLEYSFPDAENYRRREFKEIFNKNFVVDHYIDEILKPEISFLMGEKGSGKTAYAVYLSNNRIQSNICDLRFIRETEYQKFVSLKKERHLDLSDYTNIWRVIILLMLSKQIAEKESSILPKFLKFKSLNAAIDEYYLHAFSPEIIHALQFVQESKQAAEFLSKHAKASGEQKESLSFSENRFQTNLLYIQKSFEKAISELKLTNNHTLFIDGIDIRPDGIGYSEYLDCVKGLANAVWQLNNDFFPSIRDSKGRLKSVLLVRPDIFSSIGLQNRNTKIRTNSVYLDWRTSYSDFSTSSLYRMCDTLLYNQQERSVQNDFKKLGDTWNAYFPYTTKRGDGERKNDSSFIGFLRYSFYRPRDIIMMLEFLKDIAIEKSQTGKTSYNFEDFDNPTFKRKLSDHLLGEIKDQISFYYNDEDYEFFLKFFELLQGSTRFNYEEYLDYHESLISYINTTGRPIPNFMDSANQFLQFLYELNVICYVEDVDGHKPMIHWCFRDKSFSNFSPKVKEGVRYEIFYGLTRAVNAGRKRIK